MAKKKKTTKKEVKGVEETIEEVKGPERKFHNYEILSSKDKTGRPSYVPKERKNGKC